MLENKTQDILQQLKANDQATLKLLFNQHYPSVCRAVYRFIRDKATVEDIAQDVFIKLWEKRQQLNVTTSFGAYLNRMAINEAISYIRRNKKYQGQTDVIPEQVSTETNIEKQYLQTELEEKITAAINTLPPRCRAIFQLSRFEDLSYREIAERLDISIKTVENQMGKALKTLRTQIGPYLNLLIISSFWQILKEILKF